MRERGHPAATRNHILALFAAAPATLSRRAGSAFMTASGAEVLGSALFGSAGMSDLVRNTRHPAASFDPRRSLRRRAEYQVSMVVALATGANDASKCGASRKTAADHFRPERARQQVSSAIEVEATRIPRNYFKLLALPARQATSRRNGSRSRGLIGAALRSARFAIRHQ